MNTGVHCVRCVFLSGESTVNEAAKTTTLERQREYKMAALRAKKQGDMEQAKLYFKTSKVSYRTEILSDLLSVWLVL